MSAKPDTGAIGRRRFLARAAGGLGAMLLSGCDRLSSNPQVSRILDSAERLSELVQRLIAGRAALAREYGEADISRHFKSNGTSDPDDEDYQALATNGFADWRLEVGGLVERPLRLSLDELRALPSRTQITRHDCVEGWSCIGKWKGAKLGALLDRAGVRPEARYLVFFCADTMNPAGDKYYESIDLASAYHPQTILAYEMNDQVLPVPYGAPLRLRLERQLGYKMAKYIMRIELVRSFAGIGDGGGGYWEDQGYEWYAGI
jgi:DMSO/TMAO reductase YedYZ molybdopterin-dependent catalytic subunit